MFLHSDDYRGKKQKQKDYHAALDRDAQLNMGELSQGRDTGKLPLLDAARRSTNPVIKPQKLLPSDDFSALNNKVDALASHLYSNDMRMNRLEEYIRRLEGGQPGDNDLNPSPFLQSDVEKLARDSIKLKAKVEELQSILASEIKSRNQSEEELSKQILLARENMTEFSNQALDENGVAGVSLSSVVGRVDALSDQLRSVEDGQESDRASFVTLKEEVTQEVAQRLEELRKDVMSIEQASREDVKGQTEAIRELESAIKIQGDQLEGEIATRKLFSEETQKQIHHLKAKSNEEVSHLQDIFDSVQRDLRQQMKTEEVSRASAVKDISSHISSLERQMRSMEDNWESALNDGFRSVNNDMRSDRESTAAAQQELREVLSAEITSRRKTISKVNASMDKLHAVCEHTERSLQTFSQGVEERFVGVDGSLCKVTASFAEQLLSLQTATKSAVRTLQGDIKSLSEDLSKAVEEYKSMIGKCDDKLVCVESTLRQRIDDTSDTLLTLRATVDKETLTRAEEDSDIRNVMGTTTAELRDIIASDSKNHTANLLSLQNQLIADIERDRDAASSNVSALDEKLSAELKRMESAEAEARCDSIQFLKTDMNEKITAVTTSIEDLGEKIFTELSYSATLEAQTRTHKINQLAAQVKDLAERMEISMEELHSAISVDLSYAVTIEAQTRAHVVELLRKDLNSAVDPLYAQLESLRSDGASLRQVCDEVAHLKGGMVSQEQIDDLEARYAVDRVVMDVVAKGMQEEQDQDLSDTCKALEDAMVTELSSVKSMIKTVTETLKSDMQSSRNKQRVTEENLRSQITRAADDVKKYVDEKMLGFSEYKSDSGESGVTKYYVDNSIASFNKELSNRLECVEVKRDVGAVLAGVVDSVVEGELAYSIDDTLDSVKTELRIEFLAQLNKMLMDPMTEIMEQQQGFSNRIGEIGSISERVRSLEQAVDEAIDGLEILKSDVNDDLKETLKQVVDTVGKM